MRRIIGAVLIGALAVMGACTERALDPSYPAAVVSPDPGLAGVWRYEAKEGEDGAAVSLTISPQRVAVLDGRLKPAIDPERATQTVEAYAITLEAEDDLPIRVELNAYRLSINGRDYLAGQVGLGRLTESGLLPFVAPLHTVGRIERDGDTLRFWNNEPAIAWIPLAAPLDPPAPADGPPALPLRAENDDHAFVITTSIDRIVELLRRPDADRLFAGEPAVLRRETP